MVVVVHLINHRVYKQSFSLMFLFQSPRSICSFSRHRRWKHASQSSNSREIHTISRTRRTLTLPSLRTFASFGSLPCTLLRESIFITIITRIAGAGSFLLRSRHDLGISNPRSTPTRSVIISRNILERLAAQSRTCHIAGRSSVIWSELDWRFERWHRS